jgi:hypothetical protein
LGLANFYRRFVLGFSHIAWALSQITRGGGKEKFVWGRSQQQAFDDLKQCLCSAPVLSLPDLQQPFEIETDASDYVVGIVLTQHDHHMAYHSETLSYVVYKYLLMTKKCTPLCNPAASGDITFLGRRQSSTLIITIGIPQGDEMGQMFPLWSSSWICHLISSFSNRERR